MNTADITDPAAIFTAALSLKEAADTEAEKNGNNLSDAYQGYDGFLREVMRCATLFEEWACINVDFNALGEVWVYYLGDRFGTAVLGVLSETELGRFHDSTCYTVAKCLELPLTDPCPSVSIRG